MGRNYKPMPPLWRIQELVELTDDHPSGLYYPRKKKFVTHKHKHSGHYLVSLDADVYLAHRVVYYLRTGQSPDLRSITHHPYNKDKDNRQELCSTAPKRTTKKPNPPWMQDV
jgi:hypothetical protein